MANPHIHTLDVNGYYQLEFTYQPDNRTLLCGIVRNPFYNGAFEKKIAKKLAIAINRGNPTAFPAEDGHKGKYMRSASFPLMFLDSAVTFSVYIGDCPQPFGEYRITPDGDIQGDETRKLTIFETRSIACYPAIDVPYPRPSLRNISTALTCLHTHSSGENTSEDIIQAALSLCDPPFYYPTRLLDIAGVLYSDIHSVQVKRIPFLPLAHLEKHLPDYEAAIELASLTPESLAKLARAMSIPPDRQVTFGELEAQTYRLRYPMTKEPRLLQPLYRAMARRFAEQGIRYAEISATSVTPAYLRTMHTALPAIAEETGVQLRLLAAVPRALPPELIQDSLENIKALSVCPELAGIDFLGYEANKTAHFEDHLHDICRWAQQHRTDFVIRVHAGENAKNLENIKDVLHVAAHYPNIRIRVGHAVHGMDEETINLAATFGDRVAFEFNPDSNLALNNIDEARQLPLPALLNAGIPCALSSDGSGLYHTTAEQLAMAALFAGATPDGLDAIRAFEERYITQQLHTYKEAQERFPPDFFHTVEPPEATYTADVRNQYATYLQQARTNLQQACGKAGIIYDPAEVEAATNGKTALFVAGAAGTNWQSLTPSQCREVRIAMHMLVKVTDWQRVCFVTGRTKDQGVGHELNRALVAESGTEKPMFLAILAEAHKTIDTITHNHALTHMLEIPGTFEQLPAQFIAFIRDANGCCLCFGGGAFTNDFITVAKAMDVPLGLMTDIYGASANKARIMDTEEGQETPTGKRQYGFEGAKGMVLRLLHEKPEVFREEAQGALNSPARETWLNALYNRVKDNVTAGNPTSIP